MKKFILTIFVCCCISMSFTNGNCRTMTGHELFWGFFRVVLHGERMQGDGNSVVYGLAVGDNGMILRTLGQDTINFFPVNSGTTQNLTGLRIDPGYFEPYALAVGVNGTMTRSSNQGETWNLLNPVTSANLSGADIDGQDFCVAGDNGIVFTSTNYGTNWTVHSSGTTRNLKAISIHSNSESNLVAVGEKGTIIRSTNSGENWLNISLTDTTIDLYCISQRTRQNYNATNYYIAGSQGKIYKSTNLGATWILKNSGTTNTLRSIYFSGNDSGAVTGDNGTVRMTTNAGETWFSDPYFNSATGSITSISLMPRSSRTVTALSNNSTLLIASEDSITVVIGINNVSTEIPEDFSISQNYPNPFNPKTNINFQLSKVGYVKLVIYDISGKEVETLVAQDLKAGTYEVDWDGSRYSSGIYFYKITTKDFSETKKMVLVK